MKQLRVIVADDSMLFRHLLVKGLQSDPAIEVVADVGDAIGAESAILRYEPDVMVLDIELPGMSGIEFLKKLMPVYPIPTVVISSLTDRVFDAINAGAVDFVKKPVGMNMIQLERFVAQELIVKVKIASTAKLGKCKHVSKTPVQTMQGGSGHEIILAIGASTGGTEAIHSIIKHFDRNIPGVVVVQHMPPGFTDMYAKRLNEQCRIEIREAKTGDWVMPGQVLIAPGDRQMRVVKVNGRYQVECRGVSKVNGHCPSVDVLFESVASQAGKNAVGILLTGMGADGANGLLKMKKAGAVTIGQNEESCVVYGMPKVAYELGAVEHQLSLSEIPGQIYSAVTRLQSEKV